jgi:iron complex outermembrane receptor protein
MKRFSSFPRRSRVAAAVSLSFASLAVNAQSQAPAALDPVVVTGNPLRSETLTTPSSTLAGDALVLRRGSSLGDTLNGLTGVSSSYFGPNANRPVIRGQDGDRVRMLSNAGASLDASALSFDHAVPIDPLVVERVEVLRGPAALLYGGSAVGGVVNAIDNRIPRDREDAVNGAAELRLGGAANERGASAVVEGGGGGFAWHADAFGRDTDDLHVPSFDRPVDGGGTERRDRVVNSASRAKGGAVGGSMVWDHGHLGASVDTYRNDYGVVAEEDVTIRMKRDKLALAGEVRDLDGPFKLVRGQLQHTDYRHAEVEGTGEVGTTFKNKGTDGRLEAEHVSLALAGGTLRGVLGAQGESMRFSALGEEAFVPGTRTEQGALFAFEELSFEQLSLTAGARVEHTNVASDGDAPDAAEPRFGAPQKRSFTAGSVALGAAWKLSPQWQLLGNVARTERAPTYYELFANGVHVATAAYERGDTSLAKERSTNVDVALQWKEGAHQAKVGAWASRFANYIALLRTGEPDFVNDEGESFPVYGFAGVPARLHGFEAEGRWRVLDGARQVDLDGRFDLVRAENRSTGEPLPRIAPARLTLGATYTLAGWSARAEVQRVARQTRVPADDAPTDGYTLVNLSASYRLRLAATDALLFARLDNAGNTLAYNAGTIGTVRPLAPLPGRRLMAGLRVAF